MIDLETDLRRYGNALEVLMMARLPRTEEPRVDHRRRWIVAAAAAVVLLAIAGGLWFANRETSRGLPVTTEPPPKLSVLDRAPTAADALPSPGGVLIPPSPADSLHKPVVESTLRLAVAVPGWKVFLGRSTTPGDDYCLAVIELPTSRGGGSSVGCGDLSDLATDGAHLTSWNPDNTFHHSIFIGVVPDGTTSVTVAGSRAVLGENAFIARDIDTTAAVDVEIHGRTGTRSVVFPFYNPRPPTATAPPSTSSP